jgi:uncharacterized membrane protein YbhN (UPF0104 family)
MGQKRKILINVAIFVLSIWYLSTHYEEFSSLRSLRGYDITIVGGLLLFFFITTGFTFSLLINLTGNKLTALEVVALSFLTNIVNYLAPLRPGAAVKAIYLKSVKRLDYTRFSSVFAANAFLVLFTTCGVALMLLGINWYMYDLILWELLTVIIILLIFSILPFLVRNFSWIKLEGQGKFARTINNIIKGFEQIREQKTGVSLVCFSIVLQFLISGLIMMQVYQAIGVSLTYQTALMLGVFTALANLFTVTPNNIGVQEAIMGYLLMVMGGDFDQGVVGATMLRAMHILLTFSLGSILVQRMLVKANLKFRQMIP